MTWVKIDDRMPTNPKVIGLSDKAFRLYVASICYSSANLSDGEIPPAALVVIGGTPKLATELVCAGLWDTTSRKGWVVHDYLVYNRSRMKAHAVSEERRLAGLASAAKRQQSVEQTSDKPPTNRQQNVLSASASANYLPTETLGESLEVAAVQMEQNGNKLLEDADYRRILDTWLSETGTTLPRGPSERFEAYALDLNVGWVLDAIRETGSAGVKRPQYTFAILDRWKMDGREVKPETADATAKFKNDRVLAAQVAWKERNG